MTSIPRRAKSCLTCRIRRKGGCDMERPSCGQCVSRGLKCDGYERPTVFVNTTASGPSKKHQHRRQQQEYHQWCQWGNRKSLPILAPAPGNDNGLAKSAHEEMYFGLFWNTYLPHGKQIPSQVMSYTGGGWTNVLPELARASPIIRKILLAFSLTTAGHVWDKRREKEEGLRYYVDSLRDMSTAIADPKGISNHVALCLVARMYSLYEIMYGQDGQNRTAQARNWRKHIDGELALITSQPPESYISGYSHQFFVDGRFHITTGAITMRKKTVFSSHDWKTIPWRSIPKTPKDLLLDIFVEMPALLQDVDTMLTCTDPSQQSTIRKEITRKCWLYENELFAWRAGVGMPKQTYPPNVDMPSPPLDLIATSHIMSIYWSMCIIIYSALHLASEDATTLPEQTDPGIYCRRIAEAVPVLLHPQSGVYGVHLANFPTAVALLCLNAAHDGDVVPEEKRIILDALRMSANGRIAGRLIASTQRQDLRSIQMTARGKPRTPQAVAGSWLCLR